MSAEVIAKKAHFDAAVVGNGALGLALGLELCKRGIRTVVIGPAQRDMGASKAAGAMNGCFGEVTTDLFSSPYGHAKFNLDFEATAVWDDWADEIAASADVPVASIRQKKGTTVILNAVGTQKIDTENFWLIRQTLEEFKAPYSLLEENEIPWVRPHDSSRSFRALHLPGEHNIVTPNYLSALETAFVGCGGELVDGTVERMQIDGAASCSLTLSDQSSYSASVAVLAAGAYSHSLLRGINRDLASLVPPIVSGYGVSVLLSGGNAPALEQVIRTPNRAFGCGLHIVPRADAFYLGATNGLTNNRMSYSTMYDLHFLMECGMKQLHTELALSQINSVQVGNRPVSVDGFPLLGSLPGTPLWMMTGTYRDGFHQSPLLAKILAKAIADAGDLGALSVFAPVRAPIQAMTREQVAASGVKHMLAAGFESDWRIPPIWTERLEQDFMRKFVALADDLHETFTPPADVLALSNGNPWLHGRVKSYYASYT